MKDFWNGKRITLACIFILGLLFILFVGRKFNPETLERNRIFTTKGVNHFRKGLDISGGTKLVYKVDYGRYKDVYSPQDFSEVKKTIEEVILKNIDSRISTLWVSDYKAYVQNVQEETQIVVEIGGIADLDQAKEIIGRTVELEFRIENREPASPELLALRAKLAEDIRNDVLKNPEQMISLYENKSSDNILARSMVGVSEMELPAVYLEKKLLDTPLGEISPLVVGKYDSYMIPQQGGGLEQEDVNGFLIYRINEKNENERTLITPDIIKTIAKKHQLSADSYTRKGDQGVAKNTYAIKDDRLIYNNGSTLAKEVLAYDVKVVKLKQKSLFNKSEEEKKQIEADHLKELADIKEKGISHPSFSSDLHLDGYVSEEVIKKLIPELDVTVSSQIKEYTSGDTTYFVLLKDVKNAGEEVFSFVEINKIPDVVALEKELATEVTYSVDEILVQDRLGRKIAQGNDGSILNGAYFTLARPSLDQYGRHTVEIDFNAKGKEIFCEITGKHIGEAMGIFIGGQQATVATINDKICDGRAVISGSFRKEDTHDISKQLNSGNMPAPLILVQESKVSPSLGDTAFQWALIATLVGVLAIVIYIFCIYGWRKSLVTIATMVFFFVVLLTILKFIDYALSLSGIAAIILSIGMAVDANILIFERMNEEIQDGKSASSAISIAMKRSWAAIRDGQISTLLIWLLLFAYGINMFKGFGSMIVLTALLTLFVNVPFMEEILKIVYSKKSK